MKTHQGRNQYLISAAILLMCIRIQQCSKILAIFPTPAKSHQIIFDTILVELYQRGHDLTVITQYPETLVHYERMKVLDIKGTHTYNSTIEDIYELSADSIKRIHINFIDQEIQVENIFLHENMKSIWNMENKYDLIITEMFLTDAFLVIPYLYKVPYISIASSTLHPQHSERLGLPDNPSYIPSYVSAYTDHMSFTERLSNTFVGLYYKWYYDYKSHGAANRIIHKYFPEIPRIQDLLNTCSLTLVNTHHTINIARPLPANVVEIGGIHVKPAKKLNEEMERFLNESHNGVIYFSMGSMLKTSSFPPDKFKAFLKAFSKIPQRVLWKFEDNDTSIFKPYKNIRTSSWMPQRDIFAHPNMKLFISHGGLLGITEAVYEGIPVLGIPVFGDQWANIKKLESLKAGKLLPYLEITEETVSDALKIVLSPEYKENAEDLGTRFRDRPQSPLEVAIYWIEYVIKYNGAYHLQSAAVKLTWYQYYLLDIALVLIVGLVSVCFVLKYLCGSLVRRKHKTE
ncbi:UDP-glucuronosyltransferase 2B31-like [Diaphorina citri]|uniref:UDP-glucuronosyltransferase 2B31-like n=1 Tax=Diaphorina citri TaxID=121845 RepID=A0A1S3CYB2_DIACI|nr:UDP-glucuronosyltransferase 2B31-like [Diaphorina citri]XP_017298871.1 UDP-glucuronosyltransferase 2B31-like [Diaphorina citri]